MKTEMEVVGDFGKSYLGDQFYKAAPVLGAGDRMNKIYFLPFRKSPPGKEGRHANKSLPYSMINLRIIFP